MLGVRALFIRNLSDRKKWQESPEMIAYRNVWNVIKETRKVDSFSKFPKKTKERFQLAKAIIKQFNENSKVWACGSRVTGSYVDVRTPRYIRYVRQRFKSRKQVSDYDIYTDVLLSQDVVDELKKHGIDFRADAHNHKRILIP